MRIQSKSTLSKFYKQEKYKDAKLPLEAWYQEVKKAKFTTPNDIKKMFRNVSILKKSRLVFNIAGNKYRLIVAVRYKMGNVFICFVGPHKEYDKIDADTIFKI